MLTFEKQLIPDDSDPSKLELRANSNQNPTIRYDPSTKKQKQLECRGFVEYLRVLIDYKLSWNNHIDTILLKIRRTVGLLLRLRHFVPFSTLLSIYHSLIAPYL